MKPIEINIKITIEPKDCTVQAFKITPAEQELSEESTPKYEQPSTNTITDIRNLIAYLKSEGKEREYKKMMMNYYAIASLSALPKDKYLDFYQDLRNLLKK